MDNRSLDDHVYLSRSFSVLLVEIQLAFMVLLRSGTRLIEGQRLSHPVPDPLKERGELPSKELVAWTLDLTPEVLRDLYSQYTNQILFRYLLEAKKRHFQYHLEWDRKLEDRPVAAQFIEIEQGKRKEKLKRLVEKDQIKSFRPSEYDAEDLQQEAFIKAWELWRLPGNYDFKSHPTFFPFPFSPPLVLLPAEREFWGGPIANAWNKLLLPLEKKALPILRGDKEVIPEKIRQTLRELWRKTTRRSVILKGQEKFPESGPERWRADWDLSIRAAKERHSVIQNETTGRTSDPEKILVENQTRRENLKETLRVTTNAYEIAMKRSGKKGIVFLDGLKSGETEIQAARNAGMHDRTGRRILKAIREIHVKKLPQKPDT